MRSKHWLWMIIGIIGVMLSGSASAQPVWEALNGPDGGWVHAFYEHPITHEIYAGLRFGGLRKSTDSGLSWQYVALAPGGQNFAVTGNERGDIFVPRGGIGGRFARSTDLGLSWVEVSGIGGDCAIAWDSILIYGTTQGIYRSTDFGDTALRVQGTEGLRVSGLYRLSDGNCLFGTMDGAIYRSTDAGTTWAAIADSVPHVYHFAQYGNNIYAVTNRDGAFRSTDGGFHWTYLGFYNIQLLGVQVDTAGTVYIAGFGVGVYSSSDSGATWQEMNTGLTSRASTALYLTSGQRLLMGTQGDDGIYRADLPFTGWVVSNQGLHAPLTSALTITADGTLFAALFLDGIVKSTDGGQTWQRTGTTSSNIRTISIDETTGTVLAGSYYGSVYRSTDEGDTWDRNYVGNYPNNDVYKIVQAFGAWWAVTYTGLYRSWDDGISWYEVFYCHEGAGFQDMKIVPSTQTMILVRTYTLFDTTASAIFRSTDQGVNWSRQDQEMQYPSIQVLSDGSIYISTYYSYGPYPGFWMSDDDGVTWTPRVTGWNLIRFVVNSHDDFFVSDEVAGVRRSTDRGVTWELFNSGIPVDTWYNRDWYPEIWTLEIDDADYLYIGSNGLPIYRTIEPTAGTGTIPSAPLPMAISLSQNYPNPFNAITEITFTLPKTQPVSLRIYDVLGREVAVLVNEMKTAGEHRVTFDASGLASGVYLCRIEAGGMMQTRKIVLLR